MVNFVFGVLGEPDQCYLFATKIIEATNHNTIAAFFDECLNELSEWSAVNLLKYCLFDLLNE